jgi:hypothetical protein
MGAYFPDRQDQKNEVALSEHPLYVSLRPFVASFVEQVRSASSPEDLYAAHRKLFEKTFEYRADLELVGDDIKAGRSEIKALAQQDPKPTSRLSRQHTELQALKAAKRAAKAALSILRSLGDTLVWFALGFDRVAITALGEGQRVGYLSSGVGLDAELRALDILWADGVFAILNDLTNCLRHGDVTTVAWTHDQRDVRIAEVKAGRPLHEAARQARRLEDVVKLLQTRQHATLDQGGPLYVERSPGWLSHARRAVGGPAAQGSQRRSRLGQAIALRSRRSVQ